MRIHLGALMINPLARGDTMVLPGHLQRKPFKQMASRNATVSPVLGLIFGSLVFSSNGAGFQNEGIKCY